MTKLYDSQLNRNIFFLLAISVIILSFSLAYLTSVSISYLISTNLEKKIGNSQFKNKSTVISLPQKRSFEEFESIISGKIFQVSSGTMEAGENLPTEVKDIELLGVIAGSPLFSRALIKVKDENQIKEYAIGEIVAGNKILKIYSNSILLLRANREVELFVGEDTLKAKEKVEKTESIDSTSKNTQKVSIKRSRVLQLTQNQSQLYENKFTPITKDGKILGLKMIFIPNQNFLYELGARSGDIIRRINGQSLDNMNKLLEFWQNIQTLNRITVDIERSGKIIPFEIIIED